MKYELTLEERSYISDIDNAIAQLQLQRHGALQLCIRTRKLEGNYTYENGFLIQTEGEVSSG